MKKFLIICFTLLHSSLCFAQSKEFLNIYNWSNYIEPSVIKQFEHEHNIKINYDVFDSNYTLESKIQISFEFLFFNAKDCIFNER